VFSLVIVIIAIALFSLMMFAGSNYVDFEAAEKSRQTETIKSGFMGLSIAYDAYRNTYGKFPNDISDFVPRFTYEPVALDGSSWSYDITNKKWLCLSGSEFSALNFKSALRFQSKMSVDAVFVAASCGATSNMAEPIFPATVSITYWVKS